MAARLEAVRQAIAGAFDSLSNTEAEAEDIAFYEAVMEEVRRGPGETLLARLTERGLIDSLRLPAPGDRLPKNYDPKPLPEVLQSMTPQQVKDLAAVFDVIDAEHAAA